MGHLFLERTLTDTAALNFSFTLAYVQNCIWDFMKFLAQSVNFL